MKNKKLNIIFCLILSSIFLVTGVVSEDTEIKHDQSNAILIVNGTGTEHYSTIQDAIDNASDGDIIFVYEGIYHENLKIDKAIQLKGEDKENVIIYGNGIGNVIEVKTNDVSISGFTIQNSGKGTRDAGIKACKINSVTNGEILYNITIFGNKIFGNISVGINLRYVHNSSIFNNNISGKSIGIINELSSNNTISGNLVQHGWIYGIWIQGWMNGRIIDIIHGPIAENNIISGNTIINYRDGIMLGGTSVRNIVTGNNVIQNRGNGIITAYCFKNKITKNNLIDNYNNGCVYADRLFHVNLNTWDANYWGEPKVAPVPITGRYFVITLIPFGKMKEYPFTVYDKNPLDEPYDIKEGLK